MSDNPGKEIKWLSEIKEPLPKIFTKFLVLTNKFYEGLTAPHAELMITDGVTFAVLKAYKDCLKTVEDVPVGSLCQAENLKTQECPPKYYREGFLRFDLVATNDTKMDDADVVIESPEWPFLSLDNLPEYSEKNVDVRGRIISIGDPIVKKHRLLQEVRLVSLAGNETRLTVWDQLISKGYQVGDVVDVTSANVGQYLGKIVLGYCLDVDIVTDPAVIEQYQKAATGSPKKMAIARRSLAEGSSWMNESQLELLKKETNVHIREKVTDVVVKPYLGCPEDNVSIMTFNNRGYCSKCKLKVEAVKRHFVKVIVAGRQELRAFDNHLEGLMQDNGVNFSEVVASGQIEQKVKDLILGKVCHAVVAKTTNGMGQEVFDIQDWQIMQDEGGSSGSPSKILKSA